MNTNWVEPLSERELEVLHLIAEGLSHQEGDRFPSRSRNISSKLGVNNQMQVVGTARGLGLLDKD